MGRVIKLSFFTVFLLLVFWSSLSFAATFYISKTGNNIAPYDTWGNASTSITNVMNYIRDHSTGGDVVNIGGGDYNDRFYCNTAAFDGMVVYGDLTDLVTIQYPTYRVVSANNCDLTFNNITFYIAGGSSDKIAQSNSRGKTITFNDCIFKSGKGYSSYAFYSDAGDFKLNRCRCYLENDHQYGSIFSQAAGNLTINSSLIASDGYGPIGEIYISGSAALTINNSTIVNAFGNVVRTISSGDVTLNNVILVPGPKQSFPYCIHNTGTGIVTLNNCHLTASIYNGDLFNYGPVTNNNTIKDNSQLNFIKPRGGYIIPRVDDSYNYDYALSFGNLLKTYGFTGNYYVEAGYSSSYVGGIQKVVDQGVLQLGCHSYSHTNLSYAHALNVSYMGSDSNPTVAFSDDVITLSTTEGNDDATIDTFVHVTLGDIINNAPANWKIARSRTDGQKASCISLIAKSTSLKEMIATAVPCDIDFLRTDITEGLYKDEVADARSILQSRFNTDIGTFGYPYNVGDSISRAATIDAGFVGASYNNTTGYQYRSIILSEYDAYQVSCDNGKLVAGTSEETLRKVARGIASNVQVGGLCLAILRHNDAELTLTEWSYVLDEWSKFKNIKVCSLEEVAEDLRNSGKWTDNGDGTFSRYYNPDNYSYMTSETSPCAEAVIGIPTDLVSLPLPSSANVYKYNSGALPVYNSLPFKCQPFAVGNLVSGNLNLQVGLPACSSGVDIYLGIGLGNALFLIDSSNQLHSVSDLTVLPKWKTNISSTISESLYGNIPISILPAGVYNLYIVVVPEGETNFSHYYCWATFFDIGD